MSEGCSITWAVDGEVARASFAQPQRHCLRFCAGPAVSNYRDHAAHLHKQRPRADLQLQMYTINGVALPSSTIDWDIKNFKDIPIEERNSEELSHIEGIDDDNKLKKILIYPKKSKTLNLAFDVTPAKYVTGLITEKGTCKASSEALIKMFR